MLDFGKGSVDGWLAKLSAKELGMEVESLLDEDTHDLLLSGRRIQLTPTEFDLIGYLDRSAGKPVTRAAIVENVWGYKHTGSNVVDVTIRGLRKKLGEDASLIESIRGIGYRFRRP